MRSMRSDVMESAVSGAVLRPDFSVKLLSILLFTAQLISSRVTIAVALCGTLICIGIVRIFTPLRVDVSAEISGLDFSQHGENAYPSFNGFDS